MSNSVVAYEKIEEVLKLLSSEITIITISQFKNKYLEYAAFNFSKKHVQNIRTAFGKLIEAVGSEKLLSELQEEYLEKFLLEYFQKTKYGASLIYKALNASFNKAIKWNYLRVNPLKDFKLPRIPQNNPLYISQNDLCKILNHTHNHDLKDIFIFAFHTGCRLSEIINVKWKSIDFQENEIRIINSETFTTKSKKERCVPMNDTLKEMLVKRIPAVLEITQHEYVFSKANNKQYLQNYVSGNFKKAVRKAGINSKLHFHCLRHGFASELVQYGISIYTVKELLGHADIKTTQIYAHLQKEQLAMAVMTLDRKAI